MKRNNRSWIFVPSLMALMFSVFAVSLCNAAVTNYWISLGPSPIQNPRSGYPFGKGPISGRVSAIAVHPINPDHWLIGAAFGGIWETRDAGTTWLPRTETQPTK